MGRERFMPTCTFMSRSDVLSYLPVGTAHLVSISDDHDDQARIDERRWQSVSYHHFVDAGFDEEIIGLNGDQFEVHYADYFLASKADMLRVRLQELVSAGQDIVINCQAGRSRSAAVAMYLNRVHGYQLDKPTPDANLCVYRMLAQDPSLLAPYARATSTAEPQEPSSIALRGWMACRRWLGLE